MGRSERNTFTYQVISQLRSIRIALGSGNPAAFFIKRQTVEHFTGDTQTAVPLIHRIEGAFFVFLHVFVISQRQTFHGNQQRLQVAKYPAAFTAQ